MSSSTGVFVQKRNPLSGKTEWEVMAADYDYHQQVARAGFADMLHDSERNRMYYDGLRSAIATLRRRGDEVHVLDIGTGTGLLAMMAARLGADSVVAVEEFEPMACCAARVMLKNKLSGKIELVRKRSTEMEVGPGKDMERRANLLVTEVFDTELIGEGAIDVFNHACQHLLTEDRLVVPATGTMYAQVVNSDIAARWNDLRPIFSPEGTLMLMDMEMSAEGTKGVSLALHDLQLSQMRPEWFSFVTDPLPVFSFDFACRESLIPARRQTVRSTTAKASGVCDAVFIWWEVFMDDEKKIRLSCAPKWAHPNPTTMPWRDHWMQAVYYPLSKVYANAGRHLAVVSNHDDFSLWFDVSVLPESHIEPVPLPRSTPGLQTALSRRRLGQINDRKRNNVLIRTLQKALPLCPSKSVLCFCEHSLLPLLAAKVGFQVVVAVEKNSHMVLAINELVRQHYLQGKIRVLGDVSLLFLKRDENDDMIPAHVDLVIGEPNFAESMLPWENLRFWFLLDQLREGGQISVDQHAPLGAEIWAVPVEFADLWKIRSPVGIVEGFDLGYFDDIIMKACEKSDEDVEAHPLWEYQCTARGAPVRLMSFDFAENLPEETIELTKSLAVEGGTVNGLAMWMTWRFDATSQLSSGPTEPVTVGETIEWDVHSKQGVHFFVPDKPGVFPQPRNVIVKTIFEPMDPSIDFEFSLDE